MKVFQTNLGVARAEGEALALLDGTETVHGLVATGRVAELETRAATRTLALADVTFEPLVRPSRFIIAGLNYRAHCEEIGVAVPEKLRFAPAPGSAVHAAGVPVQIPDSAPDQVDYEGEIGIVIGSVADHVEAAAAWSVVAGLVALNDVSARDVQGGGTPEAVGQAKGFATFKPCGPCLATLDEFADPLDIGIETRVNGELRQQGRTRDMVFNLPEIIAVVTARIPLQPGDVICTGTPGGVAHGGAFPYLVPGDVVEVCVEGLPPLVNRFV